MFGRTTRGGDPDPDNPVTVRIALDGDRLTVDRQDGLDGVGAPRWAKVDPREIMPESLCKALAETAGNGLSMSRADMETLARNAWGGSWVTPDTLFAKVSAQVPPEDHERLRSVCNDVAKEHNDSLE